jgi:hypothetical protein
MVCDGLGLPHVAACFFYGCLTHHEISMFAAEQIDTPPH